MLKSLCLLAVNKMYMHIIVCKTKSMLNDIHNQILIVVTTEVAAKFPSRFPSFTKLTVHLRASIVYL